MPTNIPAVHPVGKPAGTDEGTPPPGQGWTVRVSLDFLSAERTPLSAMAKLLALALDGLARLTPFTWASNATLARTLGLSPRRVQQLLSELEAAGWLVGVFLDDRKRTRLAIILRRRVGPGTPAADTPDRLATVEAAARAGWRPARPNPDPRHWLRALGQDGADEPARNPAHPQRWEVRTPEREKPRQKNAPPSRETPIQELMAVGPVQRHDPRPAPPPPPEPTSAAEPPPAEGDRLLAKRTPAERERFRQLTPDVQARVRALMARGDRPSRESLRRLLEPLPTPKTAAATPTLPALTFAERVNAMAASGDRRLVSGFASSLALNLGSRKDQQLFGQFVKLGERVCTGRVPAQALIGAAEAAFAPHVRNHGAYLWTTLQRDPTCAIGAGG